MQNKNESIVRSFACAFKGIKECLRLERNMMIHFTIMMLVIICGCIFKINPNEWIICTLLFGFVLSLELVNTAIEKTVDICMPKIDEKARIAKDTAAGAVLVGAIVSVIVGLIIFLPKFIECMK